MNTKIFTETVTRYLATINRLLNEANTIGGNVLKTRLTAFRDIAAQEANCARTDIELDSYDQETALKAMRHSVNHVMSAMLAAETALQEFEDQQVNLVDGVQNLTDGNSGDPVNAMRTAVSAFMASKAIAVQASEYLDQLYQMTVFQRDQAIDEIGRLHAEFIETLNSLNSES